MGAAAALIPGIVGIAGGEYAGYKKRQGEEEMQRRQAASLGRFLDPNLEMQPVRNSMGIGAPNIEQRQALAPDMMGGDATRRAIQARTPDARLNRFALEQYLTGNKAIANKLIEQRLVPGQKKYINIMDQKSGAISSIPEDQPIPFGFAIAGEAKQPEGFKVGATRDVRRGNEVVTEEWDGTKFVEIARGSAFAPPVPKDITDVQIAREQSLSSEWNPVNNFVSDTYQSVQKVYSLLESNDPVQLTYAVKGLEQAFEKGAIVRESDVNLIKAAQSKLNEFRTLLEGYKTGQPISEELKKGIASTADVLAKTVQASYADRVKAQQGRFNSMGVRGDNVTWASNLTFPTYNPKVVPTAGKPRTAESVVEKVP
jgi:hypothetical protein